MSNAEKVLARAREEERVLLALRERMEGTRQPIEGNRSHNYHRDRLSAFIDALDCLGIDRTEFNWIYNI